MLSRDRSALRLRLVFRHATGRERTWDRHLLCRAADGLQKEPVARWASRQEDEALREERPRIEGVERVRREAVATDQAAQERVLFVVELLCQRV